MRDNPARPMAKIFVPAGNIGGRGWGQERGGGGGGGESEGWSGDSGGSDATLDTGSEEEEEDHAPLTASPWGTQESGARGLRVGVRAGRSVSGKVTSGKANGRGTWSRHGAQK